MVILLVAFAVFLIAAATTKQGSQVMLTLKQTLGLVASKAPFSPASVAAPSEKPQAGLFPTSNARPDAPTFFPLPESDPSLTPTALDTHDTRDHIYVNKVIRYPYHQTMAHQPMATENWVEPDKFYRDDLAYKKKLIEVQGKVVLDSLPQVQGACTELMEHLSDWLPARYPSLFTRIDADTIDNLVTHARLSLVDESGARKAGNAAMEVVSQLVQDDYLISHPNEKNDGTWMCAGGLVCFPGFYLISHKIGQSLYDAHTVVPQFNEKILKSVERSLTRMHPSQPIERTSWEIVDSPDHLFWAALAGPLPTAPGRNGAVAKPMFPAHVTGRTAAMAAAEDPGDLVLRLDHQTFVKMPKSGSVFFGVHPMRRRLRDLEDMPLLPQLIVRVMTESSRDLLVYKGCPAYEETVVPYLRAMHQRQIDRGLIIGDEDVKSYREVKAALDAKGIDNA